MYKDYYKLAENPFNVTADPQFFYSSVTHAEAYSNLVYGIQHRKGIMVVTGEIGTGKTTLCKTVLNRMDKRVQTALILNPNFSELQLLQLIIRDLGISIDQRNKFSLINTLNEFLLEESNRGNNVVILIDESQNLNVKQLEQIRLLSNLETDKEKLLQIILFGQPELYEKLKLPALRQLDQRVAIRFNLQPLKRNELPEYISYRLHKASTDENHLGELAFTNKAIDAIYSHSQGMPRMVNILCDRALLAGFIDETTTINDQIIQKCIEEVQ